MQRELLSFSSSVATDSDVLFFFLLQKQRVVLVVRRKAGPNRACASYLLYWSIGADVRP